MIDSDEIEVKIVMNLNALVLKQTDTGIIREIEERELDREKLQSMPGIVGYQVQPRIHSGTSPRNSTRRSKPLCSSIIWKVMR